MALANNADYSKFAGEHDYKKGELQFLAKQLFWIVYYTVDPNFIVFSWKKLFISKTWRWKDLYPIFKIVFGPDPFGEK